MKSIMEQAASITKAIEKAWQRSGCPRNFSVKVLEPGKKNFFGFVSSPAKIAFIFDEKTIPQPEGAKKKERVKRSRSTDQRQKPTRPQQKNYEKPSAAKSAQRAPQQMGFDVEMVSAAKQWLERFMALTGHKQIAFRTDSKGNYIKFTFEKQLYEDIEKQRQLFRSCSYLMLQALRNSFKRKLRGCKIILNSQ